MADFVYTCHFCGAQFTECDHLDPDESPVCPECLDELKQEDRAFRSLDGSVGAGFEIEKDNRKDFE